MDVRLRYAIGIGLRDAMRRSEAECNLDKLCNWLAARCRKSPCETDWTFCWVSAYCRNGRCPLTFFGLYGTHVTSDMWKRTIHSEDWYYNEAWVRMMLRKLGERQRRTK